MVAAVVACLVLVVVATGWPVPSPFGADDTGAAAAGAQLTADGPAAGPAASTAASTYTVMQMNLCLSGMAGCYQAAAYPAVVDEAVRRIRALRPDAVTVTEACRRDAELMARRVGYHLRFERVRYAGAPLPCVDPRGRGLFGDAVLTRAAVVGFETRAFTAQSDLEERRWLCATTGRGVDICTAHLETPHTSAAATARDAQCAELADVLAARPSRAFVFGGDLNRVVPCAPPGTWMRTDSAADQAPGIQHVYGSAALGDPRSEVLPAAFSDHDVLVVHATLTRR